MLFTVSYHSWEEIKKLIGKCFPKQYVEPQKPQNLKKILRKSQASNAWAATLKNARAFYFPRAF